MALITVCGPAGPPVSYRFEQDVIRIGRSALNDLVLSDPGLSRRHAELRRAAGGWIVVDLDSRNGTRRNGRPVRGTAPLLPGDEVSVGLTTIVFDLPAARVPGETEAPETERPTASARTDDEEREPALVGRSSRMREVRDLLLRIAASAGNVLIVGESGTGKELAARLLHRRSPRADGPFVVVNCPALPGSLLESELFGVEKGVATGVDPRPGRFETAHGGTLFLDEIGDMDLAAQAKILRVLQERTIERVGGRKPVAVDVRIVAATNHDLERDIEHGTFRRDLYHRLNVFAVRLPPLRDRMEDLPDLVEHFLAAPGGPALPVGPGAFDTLKRYRFPGNVRELQHALERARFLARGPAICEEDLPQEIRGAGDPVAGSTDALERTAVPASTTAFDPATAEALYDRIVQDGASFWEVVQGPYLRREISREEVRRLIARVYAECGRSYREVARRLRIEADHKKLLNFLRNHGLRVERLP